MFAILRIQLVSIQLLLISSHAGLTDILTYVLPLYLDTLTTPKMTTIGPLLLLATVVACYTSSHSTGNDSINF